MKETYWKYSLIILIVGLGILLFRQAQPYMNGILGGFTLYLLLRGFTNWMKTQIKPLAAVWIVTIGTTLFILIPLSLFSWALVNQISNLRRTDRFRRLVRKEPLVRHYPSLLYRTFHYDRRERLDYQLSRSYHAAVFHAMGRRQNGAIHLRTAPLRREQQARGLAENPADSPLQRYRHPAFGNHPGHHLPLRIPALRSAEPRPYSHAHRLRVDYPHCRDGIGMAPGYGLFLSHGRLGTRADTFRLRQPHRCPMR